MRVQCSQWRCDGYGSSVLLGDSPVETATAPEGMLDLPGAPSRRDDPGRPATAEDMGARFSSSGRLGPLRRRRGCHTPPSWTRDYCVPGVRAAPAVERPRGLSGRHMPLVRARRAHLPHRRRWRRAVRRRVRSHFDERRALVTCAVLADHSAKGARCGAGMAPSTCGAQHPGSRVAPLWRILRRIWGAGGA